MRNFNKVIINKKAENKLKNGHLWVYGEEITHTDDNINNGDIIDIFSSKNRYMGSGFYNSNSKIAVRMISDNANEVFDEKFFYRRIKYAVDYRLTVMNGDLSCTRLVFGDSDMLPGFIADKFGNVIVTQIMCLGIEKRKDIIFEALLNIMNEYGEIIDIIYERNDVAVRKKEGLELSKGYYPHSGLKTEDRDTEKSVIIDENGIKYRVDYINGQKTGYFLDQKFNRLAAASLAKGKQILDCFTHTGAFALNCAKNGAKSVTAVDISETAVNMSKENARLNDIENVEFIKADVFDYLTELEKYKSKIYDYIILDPPAFTKSNSTVASAYKGYKEINMKAMKILPRGGYLATCSCSHFMTDELFGKMLHEAASEANVRLKIIEKRMQSKDHPVLDGVEETQYLKFYILQII